MTNPFKVSISKKIEKSLEVFHSAIKQLTTISEEIEVEAGLNNQKLIDIKAANKVLDSQSTSIRRQLHKLEDIIK